MRIRSSVRMRSDFTPQDVKRAENFRVAARTDAGTDQYDQIEVAQPLPVEPEAFADQSLDTVTLDGVTGIFYRHDGAEPWMTQTIVFRKHGDGSITDLEVALPKYPLEPGGCQQTVRGRVGGACARQGNRSDRKTRATFCPASLNDKTTVLGAHTGTETVCTLALQVARLECSLHGANRSQKRLKARQRRAKSGRADYWLYPPPVNR